MEHDMRHKDIDDEAGLVRDPPPREYDAEIDDPNFDPDLDLDNPEPDDNEDEVEKDEDDFPDDADLNEWINDGGYDEES
jgi:hypothetical protein